jgi:hypothetical protein
MSEEQDKETARLNYLIEQRRAKEQADLQRQQQQEQQQEQERARQQQGS